MKRPLLRAGCWTFVTSDRRAFTEHVEACQHEVVLAEQAVRELCREHVQAGPADALTVATLLLDPAVTRAFKGALDRVCVARAALDRAEHERSVSP